MLTLLDIATEQAQTPNAMYQPEPRALDTSLLQKIASDNKETKLAEWKVFAQLLESVYIPDPEKESSKEAIYQELDKLVAESKILCHQRIRDAEGGGSLESPVPLAEHVGRIAWLAEIKESSRPTDSEPDASTDADLSDRWIRKQLQSRWKEKYAALTEERAVLKARKTHAEVTENAEEMKKIRAEKRKLHRELFNQCVEEELTDFLTQSQKVVDTCLEEILELGSFYESQFKTLLESEGLSNQAILSAISRHEEMVEELTPKIDRMEEETDILEAKLQDADRASRKLITRMHRLCANDVDDPDLRTEEINRRLSHPHAHLYVLKALEDVRNIPRDIKPALKAVENLEEEIKSIQRISINAFSGLGGLV